MAAAPAAGAASSGGRGPAKKTAAKRAPAKKSAPAKKTAAKRAPAKKSAPAKKTAASPSADPSTPVDETPAAPAPADTTEDETTEETEETPARRDYVGDALGHDATQTGAGIILGVIGYALLVNYLKSGPAGVKKWLAAKFLNRDDSSGLILGGGIPLDSLGLGSGKDSK